MTAESYGRVITAVCLWREARGCDQEARRAVLHVILNRARAKFRGDSPLAVILAPYQFSSFNRTDANASLLPNPKAAGDWRAWLECCALVDEPGADPTNGALMYHSYEPGSPRWPDWAVQGKQTARAGPFWFYRV